MSYRFPSGPHAQLCLLGAFFSFPCIFFSLLPKRGSSSDRGTAHVLTSSRSGQLRRLIRSAENGLPADEEERAVISSTDRGRVLEASLSGEGRTRLGWQELKGRLDRQFGVPASEESFHDVVNRRVRENRLGYRSSEKAHYTDTSMSRILRAGTL